MSKETVQEYDKHKLMYHPNNISRWLNKEKTYPIYVEIAPTSACNYKCIFCAFDYVTRNVKTIEEKLFYSLIDEFKELGVKSVMLAGEGEPLLHKSIGNFVSYTKKNNIDVSVTTNGSLLNRVQYENFLPYLSWMRISFNAASEKTYMKTHSVQGKMFYQTMENIKNAMEFKRKNKLNVNISMQFLLVEENAHELIEIAKVGKELGVDYLSIKPYSQHPKSINKLGINYENFEDLKEEIMSYATDDYKILYRVNAINSLMTKKQYEKCYGLDFFSLIDADGNVIPCNLFYTGTKKDSFGNIRENSFKDIWDGQKRKEVIDEVNKNLCTKCRLGCRLDSINNYLHRIINPFEHDNFI